MHRYLLPLCTFLFCLNYAQAESLYLLLEEGCADRIRYEQAIGSQPRTDYYAYSFTLPDGVRMNLETGVEGTTVQDYIPIGYIGCNDPRLTADLARRVGNGTDQLYLLRPTSTGQYYVLPVQVGAVTRRNNDMLTYTSTYASFRLDRRVTAPT